MKQIKVNEKKSKNWEEEYEEQIHSGRDYRRIL